MVVEADSRPIDKIEMKDIDRDINAFTGSLFLHNILHPSPVPLSAQLPCHTSAEVTAAEEDRPHQSLRFPTPVLAEVEA